MRGASRRPIGWSPAEGAEYGCPSGAPIPEYRMGDRYPPKPLAPAGYHFSDVGAGIPSWRKAERENVSRIIWVRTRPRRAGAVRNARQRRGDPARSLPGGGCRFRSSRMAGDRRRGRRAPSSRTPGQPFIAGSGVKRRTPSMPKSKNWVASFSLSAVMGSRRSSGRISSWWITRPAQRWLWTSRWFTELLRRHDLPVPEYCMVNLRSIREATAFVLDGGPCVVKPANGTGGGAGVICGVESPDDLGRAFLTAGSFDENVLVERAVEGTEYRLLFLDGELLDVVCRARPSVEGGRAFQPDPVDQRRKPPPT